MTEKDTLWSWVVLTSVTLIVFLETGMMKSLSVLLPDLREQLSSPTWIIGSCISIVYGWGYVIGMGSGSLLSKFGARVTLSVSGILTCLGLILCACATNTQYFLCGLLLTGFVFIQENVAIGLLSHYFDKYFAISLSIFLVGCNVAVIVMPPVMQLFQEAYGWRGAMALLSAISFHSVVCSVLIKGNKMEDIKTSKRRESKQENTPLLSEIISTTGNTKGRCGFCKSILDSMGASLLRNTTIIVCVIVPSFAWGYSMTGWLIYTVSYAVSIGATMKEAALVSTCGGISLTFTRIVLPLISKRVHYKFLLYSSLLLASASLSLGTIWVTLYGMYISSALFGAAISVLSTAVFLAAQANTSDNDYVYAVAWLHLVFGFASILTGAITGIIYDVRGSFRISFAVLAAVPLLSVIPVGLYDLYNLKL